MAGNRDDFTSDTIQRAAKRVGYLCSCPTCRVPTTGPSQEGHGSVSNIGEAAHICAAAPGGPRFDPNMTSEERKGIENCIWLCRTHARLIDTDTITYTVELLKRWKKDAETYAAYLLANGGKAEGKGDKADKKEIPVGGAFSLSHPFRYFGHENEVAIVLNWFADNKIIIVYGEGGIGKTEFCREVLDRATKAAPECVVNAVNLIECRDFSQFIRRVAGVMGIAVAVDDTPESIEGLVLSRLSMVKGILYLDNFEDVMSEAKTEKAERRRVLAFLNKCRNDAPVTVLVSSRKRIQGLLNKNELDLKTLDDDSAVSLFMEIWGGDEDDRIRRFVIDDLCNYPLAIILTATHLKYYSSSIEELKVQWAKARETVRIEEMENERHESVATALSITYEEVKANENARRLWELFTLFPDMIDIDTANRIIPECYSARIKLTDLSVLHKDGKMLSMLPLLREYVKETQEYREDLEVLSERLLEYYSDVFKVNRSTERGSERDLRAVDALGDALYFMDCMVGEKDADAVGKMHTLLGEFYKERPYEAIEVVSNTLGSDPFEEMLIMLRKCCAVGVLRMALTAQISGDIIRIIILIRK